MDRRTSPSKCIHKSKACTFWFYLLGRSWLILGVICVKLEIVPFVAAARATGRLAELGTRGITLLPPATTAVAVDETATGFTLEMRAVGGAASGTDMVVGVGSARHASSLSLVLPA